jgi:hypothetical protein
MAEMRGKRQGAAILNARASCTPIWRSARVYAVMARYIWAAISALLRISAR